MQNKRQHRPKHPFCIPRPSTSSNPLPDIEINLTASQNESNAKKSQVRWTEDMDNYLIISLLHLVLSGPKRTDNGFTSAQLKKVVESVSLGSHVVVTEKNVRAHLKTLKKDYADLRELFKTSGFGLDPETGRVTADPQVWEDYIKDKPDGIKLKGKYCPHYDDLEVIFGNDSATGDRAQTGGDNFSSMNVMDDNEAEVEDEDEVEALDEGMQPSPASTSSKHKALEETSKPRRRRVQPVDEESAAALSVIAEASRKIASAMELQVTLDTKTHINWQAILEKLQGMNMEKSDLMRLLKFFELDNGLAHIFMAFTDDEFRYEWALNKLDSILP